jgi:hypothetical protein
VPRVRPVLAMSSAVASLVAGVWALFGAFGTTCTTDGGCHASGIVAAMTQPGYPGAMFAVVVALTVAGIVIPWWSRRRRWGLVLWGAFLVGFFWLSFGIDLYWLPSAVLCLLAGVFP